jgi:hypothetical protein
MNRYNYRVKKIDNFIPDIPINEDSRDNLFSLATSHDIGGLEEFITTNSISLNVKNNNNQTIIHVLLDTENTTDEKDLLRCIKFLVNKGAYISNSDNFLLTPLFICIKKNYPYIFNYLLNEGANTNINTYDNLTVMHVLAQPGYITYDANGIQSIIPDKLPKFDMEKYKIIYKEIEDVLNLKSDEFNITLLDEIAKQFYYHDEKEDFNNKLLIDEYEKDLLNEKKTNIFEKIKNKLEGFYTSDKIEEVDINDLNEKLTNIKNKLNDEISKEKMHILNNNVLNAIKNLAYSLELSIHYFFLKDPENTNIATSVIIATAERAMALNFTPDQLIETFEQFDVIREAIQAVKAATSEAKRGGTKASDIINAIKTAVENPRFNNFINNEGSVYLAIQEAADEDGPIARIIRFPTNPNANDTAYYIGLAVQEAAIITPPFVRIMSDIFQDLENFTDNNNVIYKQLPLIASNVLSNLTDIVINTERAVTKAIAAAIPATIKKQVQIVTVVQTGIGALVYATVYIKNKISNIKLSNLSAVHTSVHTAVGAGVQNGIQLRPGLTQVANQEKLQRALTDPVVAVESVVNATYKAIIAVYTVILPLVNNNTITDDDGATYMIEAIKEALQYIEVSNEDIDTIIVIATEAAQENVGLKINAIMNTLTQRNNVKIAVQIIQAVSAVPGTNKKIIDVIRKEVAILAVNAATNVVIAGNQEALNIIYIDVAEAATVYLQELEYIDPIVAIAVRAAITNPKPTTQAAATFTRILNTALRTLDEEDPHTGFSIIDDLRNDAINVVSNTTLIEIYTYDVVNRAVEYADGGYMLKQSAIIQIQIVTVLQSSIQSGLYAAVYTQNKALNIELSNLSAVYVVVNTAVVAGVQRAIQLTPGLAQVANQEELQRALTDPVVATEAVIYALFMVSLVIHYVILPLVNADTISNDIGVKYIVEALKEALKLPPIIPEQFKNDDYNKLIKSYKLINIPQKYINYNISYNNSNNNIDIKQAVALNNYKLPEGDITYSIDYFNLLYTFNEYVRDNYNPPAIIITNDIFQLYQCIQQIYKYNYIIYIFDKEKNKILKLKDNYIPKLNTGLKETINKLFDTNYYDLVRSVDIIKKQLETIKNLANDYIDNYNKLNGYKIYINSDANTNNIGIYPQIKFSTEIKHSLGDENAIILNCNDYITYNKNKKDFFHNFVLYFQDIGIYQDPINPANPANLLNNIPIPINYNINITDYYTNDKNKLNKIFFYDPIYLKLIKQYLIRNMLINNNIISIRTENQDIYNPTLSQKLDDNIKKTILNEILNNNFDIFLNNAIDNLLKEEVSLYPEPIIFEKTIEKPDFYAMLSESLGFSNILIPNYEFTNNKFLSISKNRFLKCILYFDTKYFEPTNISTLNYYKNNNNFIDKLLLKNKPLIFKTDIKGQTPLYYAIDGNNFNVIEIIIKTKNTLFHYDNKNISPLQLCINKQLQHLNYLLDDDNEDEIHYLNHYINMLRTELKNNKISIPSNIESVFIIALFIQNHIWLKKATRFNLKKINVSNTRKKQFDDEYKKAKKNTENSDVNNKDFKYNDTDVKNNNILNITYKKQENTNYNYNDDDNNKIFDKYYKKAKNLEKKNFGLYGSYWKNYDKNKKNKDNILEHINQSKELKNLLKKHTEIKINVFNTLLPKYDDNALKTLIDNLNLIKKKLEHYLKFINIRFNSNQDNNNYVVFLNKIYVHVLANIIGVDFYLTMEKLIVTYYIGKGATINNQENVDNIKNNLLLLNKFLINNKLDKTNINFLYITEPIPESVLKDNIKDILIKILPNDNKEIINNFETIIFPMYRELYKITYKYLKMFMSNYHKFIYNQYHGLDILLLLLNKISS